MAGKGSSREFKRYICAACGERFGLEPALGRVRRDFQLPEEIISLCPRCRRKRAAESLAASLRQVPSPEGGTKKQR